MTRLHRNAFLLVALLGSVGIDAQGQAPAPGGEVKLVSVPTGAMAPASVHVNAFALGLPEQTRLSARFEWDFDDPGSGYNRLVGWNAAHTYDRPGTYTIRLTVTALDGTQTQYAQTVMIHPDRRRAMYVSEKGDDRHPGTSPDKPKRTILRALTNSPNDDVKILLRRGEQFEISSAIKPRGRNVLIGAYGESSTVWFGLPAVASIALPDDRPRIVWTGRRVPYGMIEPQASSRDFVLQDVAIDTVFTQDAEKSNMPIGMLPRGVNTTLRRCTFYNVGDGLNANQKPVGVLMQDCAAMGASFLRSYLAWVEGADQVYLGNLAFNSTREAVFRIGNTGGRRVLVAHNTFANLDRTSVDRIDTAKNALTVQFGSDIYIADNTLLIGPVVVGPLGERDGLPQKSERLRRVVVEGNRIARSQLRVAHGTIGLEVRNNRFYANDRTAINVEGYNREYQRGSTDVTIVHNTASNLGSRGNFLRVGGGVQGVRVINNLYSAPNLAPGSHESAVVYVGQSDLAGFVEVRGNVWPVTRPLAYARGGAFYVWPSWSDERGYLTLEKWLAFPPVDGDVQAEVAVDDALRPVQLPDALLRPSASAFDALGRRRNRSRSTPGAIELDG